MKGYVLQPICSCYVKAVVWFVCMTALMLPGLAKAQWDSKLLTWQTAGLGCEAETVSDVYNWPMNGHNTVYINDMPIQFYHPGHVALGNNSRPSGGAVFYLWNPCETLKSVSYGVNPYLRYECNPDGELRKPVVEVYEAHYKGNLYSGYLNVGQNWFTVVMPASFASTCSNRYQRIWLADVKTNANSPQYFNVTGEIVNIIHFKYAYPESVELSPPHYSGVPVAPSSLTANDVLAEGSYASAEPVSIQRMYELHEINRTLADKLSDLIGRLDREAASLSRTASDVNELRNQVGSEHVARLVELRNALNSLLEKSFDDITDREILELLEEFSDVVSSELADSLIAFVDSLLTDLEELRAQLRGEVISARDDFASLADVFAQSFEDHGIDRETYDYHSPIIISDTLPPVELPDPTAPGEDVSQYFMVAEDIIEQFAATIEDGRVVGRAEFLGVWSVWANWYDTVLGFLSCQVETPEGCGLSSGTQAHLTALLDAHHRVLSFVNNYFDTESGFFRDIAIPHELPNAMGEIQRIDSDVEQALRWAINTGDHAIWDGWETAGLTALDMQYAMIVLIGTLGHTIRHAGALNNPLHPDFMDDQDVMQMLREAIELVSDTYRFGVSFIPVAGQALDFCEAATGREWCIPNGRELSTTERTLSLVFIGVGTAAFWKVAGDAVGGLFNAALNGVDAVFHKASELIDAIRQGASKYQTLITPVAGLFKRAGGYPVSSAQLQRDQALLELVNGEFKYKNIPFAYLDEVTDRAGNINLTGNTWGLGHDAVEAWTFAVVVEQRTPGSPAEHVVRIAPKVVAPSPAQLAAASRTLSPEQRLPASQVVANAGGTVHALKQGTLQPHISWVENATQNVFDVGARPDWHDNYLQELFRASGNSFAIVEGMYSRNVLARMAKDNNNATLRLFERYFVSNDVASAYALERGWGTLANTFEAAVGDALVEQSHRMIVVGDTALKRMFGANSSVVDFVTLQDGRLVLTEVKNSLRPSYVDALGQLTSVYGALVQRADAYQVTLPSFDFQIVIPKGGGGAVSEGYRVVNGFLYSVVDDAYRKIGEHRVKVLEVEHLYQH